MTEPLSPSQSAALADFARTCKAAARAVTLYPPTHPSIEATLTRVIGAAARVADGADVTLGVHPNALVLDGRAAARPDPAIGELAALLHERLVGSLRIARDAGPQDWLALLMLLGKPPEDVIGEGGIRRMWAATGRSGFEIRGIDYAEVLRERAGGERAVWDRIVASYLEGSMVPAETLADAGAQMPDEAIASFIAQGIVAAHGATDRLAQAFQALVPEDDRKTRLLQLAHDEAAQTPLGGEAGFEDLWQSAASMLTTYSDGRFVSADYGRELSGAQEQAIEVDRVSDDPPERVQAWLATVNDAAVRELDVVLLQDLLRIEEDPAQWKAIAAVAAREIERRTQLGEVADALRLLESITGRGGTADQLASTSMVRHITANLRKSDDRELEPLTRLCHAIGPRLARPLAEALATEADARAVRRLRELLISFGAAGRQSVEQLRMSANPAVRRMAIELLRVFGGREALPELAAMLDDADPQVQRESIRAMVQIGTPEAYAILERSLAAGGTPRETVIQELVGLRDEKAVPLLCYVLNHTSARGPLIGIHLQIIEALGALGDHPESTQTLERVLHRGEWWAPGRTARLRSAAATALRRIGSAAAVRVLEDAVAKGGRGVRSVARVQLGAVARRERARS